MNPTSTSLDSNATATFVEKLWDSSVVPTLMEYIRIPNKSQVFDPQWVENGHMERAVTLISEWCRSQAVPGMQMEVVRLAGKTPVIFIEVPGQSGETVLLYGHLDKQPEMIGWSEGLDPWTPVMRGDRLYGRGSADDGYAAFASLGAIKVLHDQGVPHARLVVLIEAGEESGSPDLPDYIEALKDRIGTPSLVVCLDSGCGNYDQLWSTTSLRGMVTGTLHVQILTEGVHSGDAGGVVPSSFRIARELLSRLENERTGEILVRECHVDIPQQRLQQAAATAGVLGSEVRDGFPFIEGAVATDTNITELILNRTWRPSLAVTGAAGLPAIENAGNVLRPYTSLKLSLRLPPTCNAEAAMLAVKSTLEDTPPYGAQVSFEADCASGWNAPLLADWLKQSIAGASNTYFGSGAVYMGEGGSIPFMAMLGERFPQAQFLITGVLGPGSNAHGPNEFLHIPTGKRLTSCVAAVIADHFRANP